MPKNKRPKIDLKKVTKESVIDFCKNYYRVALLFILGILLPKELISISLHYSGNTSTSYFLFLILGTAIFIHSIFKQQRNKDDLNNYNPRWILLIPTILMLSIFVILQKVLPSLLPSSILLFVLLIWVLYLAFLTTFLLGTTTITKNMHEFVAYIAIICTYFVVTTLIWNNWLYLSKVITPIISIFVTPFASNIDYSIPNLPAHLIPMPLLSVDGFAVRIGVSCSGIESLSLFITLFALLVMTNPKHINIKKTTGIFLLGLIGVFFLNIIRISLLMLIGVHDEEFALNSFHDNAGWILFSIYTLLYYYFFGKYIFKKKKKNKINSKINSENDKYKKAKK